MDVIILAIIVIILNLLFWGAVIYFIVIFFRSKSTGLSNQQKIDIVTKGMDAYSTLSRGKGSKSPMDSKMGGVAAGEGIYIEGGSCSIEPHVGPDQPWDHGDNGPVGKK